MAKNQTKILFLITLSEWGGAQKYIFDLVTSLASQDYHLQVAVGGSQHGPLIQKLTKLNIQTFYLKNLQRSINFYRDTLAFWNIVRLYRELKPDIVHLNSSKAGVLGALAAKYCNIKKIIYTVHGLVSNEPLSALRKKFYSFAEWLSAKFKTHLICVSAFDKQSLLAHKITKANKIHVIHNGLDLANLKFLSKKEAQEKLDKIITYTLKPAEASPILGRQLVGTVANFYPTKGLIYLIEAARELYSILPELKFIIIGDGPQRRQLTELIGSYQLQDTVYLTGIIPAASQYLKAFDLFVLPSVKEGLSYTLIEAQAAGLPIITTSVGGNPEIVTHDTSGLIIPPGDFHSLAENIINLINNRQLAERLGRRALSSSAKFSLNKMTQDTQKIYQL